MRHFGVVGVDGIEAHFILQTEDKDDGIHPVCKLEQRIQIVGSESGYTVDTHYRHRGSGLSSRPEAGNQLVLRTALICQFWVHSRLSLCRSLGPPETL